MLDLSISIIAYKTINIDWLKNLKKEIDAIIIVSFDEPKNKFILK